MNESMANYVTDTPSEVAEQIELDKQREKTYQWCKELLEIQGRDGTWNYSPYDQGMYNGMELIISTLEGREPNFRRAPNKFLQESKFKTFLRKLFRWPKYKVVACNQGNKQ